MRRARDTVLILHDATELDYTSHPALVGTGPTARGRGQGLIQHNSLAIDAGTRRVFGLAAQQLRARIPVVYYLFDLMCSEGTDVRQRPLRERKELLRSQFSFTDPLRFTAHRSPDGETYFKQACQDRWEGLIAKRADAPYRAGRSRDWLKFKCAAGQEFVARSKRRIVAPPCGSRRATASEPSCSTGSGCGRTRVSHLAALTTT